VQLKVRFGDFRTITRSHTMPTPTDLAGEIGDTARSLLRAVDLGDGIRLLGVSVQQLEDGVAVQGRLAFDDAPASTTEDRRALEAAVGTVRERFGADAVGSAAFLEQGRLRPGRRASLWGPDDPEPTTGQPRTDQPRTDQQEEAD
jgi:DNA polymerase-4